MVIRNYSVLMSVYYKEKAEFLSRSIESMLEQTVKTDNFVLVCDGPLTKELDEVVEHFKNLYPNIFDILRLEKNSGLGYALNKGLLRCKHEWVARMDSDDIASVNRIEKQLEAINNNPQISIVGGQIQEFVNEQSQGTGIRYVPINHEEIIKRAKKNNPFNHMTVMFRKQDVLAAGNYLEFKLFEDYYLWIRMLEKGFKAMNLNEILVYARVGSNMYQRRGGYSYFKTTKNFEKFLYNQHFISCLEYTKNILVRFIAAVLLPNKIRGYLFNILMRKKVD